MRLRRWLGLQMKKKSPKKLAVNTDRYWATDKKIWLYVRNTLVPSIEIIINNWFLIPQTHH